MTWKSLGEPFDGDARQTTFDDRNSSFGDCMARSDLRVILNSLRQSELEDVCRRADLAYSGRSTTELRDALARKLNYDEIEAAADGILTIDTLNTVAERLGGTRRRGVFDALEEIATRHYQGAELDEAASLKDDQQRGRVGLDEVLSKPSVRLLRLRKYLKELHSVDRDLFFSMARNRPGPGAPILNPLANGFVALNNLRAEDALFALENLDGRMTRESAFHRALTLTHQLAPNFTIYIGRTYLRRGEEYRGLLQRWTDHWQNKNMTYATVLAKSHREQVDRDELVAIRLVKLWEDFGMLCCNNSVLSRTPTKAEDPWHVVYMTIKRR